MAELSAAEFQALAAGEQVEGLTDDQVHVLVRGLVQGLSWQAAVAAFLVTWPNVDPAVITAWQPRVQQIAAMNPPMWDDLVAAADPNASDPNP